MITLSLDEVAALCPGRLERVPAARTVTGVRIDSRRILPGDLFVAVGQGDRYVGAALEAGAVAALVPDDAFSALAALGAAVRARSRASVVGITGSAGKTSTKDILGAVCARRASTVAAEASYNNELGVPLTLCRLEDETEICVLELAMRGLGQIAELAAIARPEIGVVTNVGPAHVELVGSVEAVTGAKHELVDALPSGGTAIVPATFAVRRDDVRIVRLEEPEFRVEDGRTWIRFRDRVVGFNFTSRYQARNALAALYAAEALDISPEDTVDVEFAPWRGEELELAGGGILINDCYNANPISMRAALEDLVQRAAGRRTVAVLGEMAELGAGASEYHRDIGLLAAELGIGVVVAVGPLARHYLDDASGIAVTARAETAAAAVDVVRGVVEPGDCVLVKGSRAVGLEVVAGALAGAPV
jgi:UDP-N-acetylmuramoyl-tripeptide--D-alanyl-D-alanine ligase